MDQPVIRLAGDRNHNILEPDLSGITLNDIAHPLAMQARFTGQITKGFYSVASHSRHVANIIKAWGGTEADQRWGLLHDASEAFIGDIASPFKHLLDRWASGKLTALEERYHEQVALRFVLDYPMPEIVKNADRVAAALEVRDLWGENYMEYPWDGLARGVDFFDVDKVIHIHDEEWYVARVLWLQKAKELGLVWV